MEKDADNSHLVTRVDMPQEQNELTLVSETASTERPDETSPDLVGDAPDVSMPDEALVWNSQVFGGVQLDVSMIEPRIMDVHLRRIQAGVEGRGRARIVDGALRVQFGLTDEEAVTGKLVELYRDALLEYLRLPPDYPVDLRIAVPNVPRELQARIDAELGSIGLRPL